MSVSALAGFGHAEMLAALGAGFAGVTVLLAPKSDRETLENQVTLAKALAGGKPVDLIDPTDPDALSDVLYVETGPAVATPALPIGTRRQVTRVAAKALNPEGGVLDLPEGALDAERAVLARTGNMSAPTVLFVLEQVLASDQRGDLLVLALGPGFTLSAVPILVP